MTRTEWQHEITTRLLQKGVREVQMTVVEMWIDTLEETKEAAALAALEAHSCDAARDEGYLAGQEECDCASEADEAYAQGFEDGKEEATNGDR